MSHRAIGDRDVNVAGSPQAVTVTASPFTYTNGGPNTELLYFSQPAGATTTVARGGVTLASILTPAATTIPILVMCPPGGSVVFTYSAGAPTMARDVL
jgi:hypothetical protein